jgi:catechol 2,3-dioxygenase-like lactoylglutathione lyase family enzyme
VDKSANILDQQLVQFSTMLAVRDLSRSEQFYVRNFGFRVTESLEGLRRLQRSGVSLYLVTESPPTVDKPGVTLAPNSQTDQSPVNLIFRVRDVHATHAALRDLGITFLAPPAQPSWGGWRAFAQDPDGYLIEIEQP